MNIQISDSWLREFIETKATPKEIREYLSLCSQSVEKLIKDGKETIYNIEITTNRPDCLSIYGIARELAAVLPRFGIEARLKDVPVTEISTITDGLPLQVKISKADLCPRFTALIFDNIVIKPSPDYVQKRLNQSGVRALNNVIDISNYLMLELGQPMHTFDYDKILQNKMFLRESNEGEEIVTLDGQKRKLTQGVIIIEDGEKRIIDLCGIMGGKNSETDENTKRVLLFVQTYNPMKIRRACQALSLRTEAASRFEKGIDPEGVIPAMKRATLLFKQWCDGKIASELIDIYPHPQKQKQVTVTKERVDRIMGINLAVKEAEEILRSLGFITQIKSDQSISATVPHWRNQDIEIPEDLVEEIARIYGYHNLPNILPPLTSIQFQKDSTFEWEDKIKTALKYQGFTETVSYSLVAKDLTANPRNSLKVSNPLTKDLLYLRTSLIPGLLEIMGKNQPEENIKIFEMANIYLPQGQDKLPSEIMTLTLAVKNDKYLYLKGILESLLERLGIERFKVQPCQSENFTKCAKIFVKETNIGTIGETKQSLLEKYATCNHVLILDINLARLLPFASKIKNYIPLSKYPPIIEDFSFVVPAQTFIGPIIEEIKKTDVLIKSVELINSYENTRTFRITYQSGKNNLTDEEVRFIRDKLIDLMGKKFGGKLKI